VTSIAARCRFLLTGAATVAATALLAAPATAAVTTDAAGCPARAVTQPFALLGDNADYFLAPDGAFDQGAAGWQLRGQASVAASALRLAAGSSATTPSFCIGVEHRSMRFYGVAAASSTLNVDAVIGAAGESERSVRIATVSGSDGWVASDVVPMVVNELAADNDNAIDVQLRFTPHGAGAWSIDDVWVDPFTR